MTNLKATYSSNFDERRQLAGNYEASSALLHQISPNNLFPFT